MSTPPYIDAWKVLTPAGENEKLNAYLSASEDQRQALRDGTLSIHVLTDCVEIVPAESEQNL
jgi:hypothetical protein